MRKNYSDDRDRTAIALREEATKLKDRFSGALADAENAPQSGPEKDRREANNMEVPSCAGRFVASAWTTIKRALDEDGSTEEQRTAFGPLLEGYRANVA